jgi:hypothetical protein
MTPGYPETARQNSNARVRAAGLAVLDLDAIFGTGGNPNVYKPGFTSRTNHPNDAAHAAVVPYLVALLRQPFG